MASERDVLKLFGIGTPMFGLSIDYFGLMDKDGHPWHKDPERDEYSALVALYGRASITEAAIASSTPEEIERKLDDQLINLKQSFMKLYNEFHASKGETTLGEPAPWNITRTFGGSQ